MRGEAAESGGYIETGTNIEYKTLCWLRKEYKVTDYAGQAVLDITFMDDEGRITILGWICKKLNTTWYMNKEMAETTRFVFTYWRCSFD